MDRALILAQGKALALLAVMLENGRAFTAQEFGAQLGIFSVVVAEDAPAEGDILAVWASIIRDINLDGDGPGRPGPPRPPERI